MVCLLLRSFGPIQKSRPIHTIIMSVRFSRTPSHTTRKPSLASLLVCQLRRSAGGNSRVLNIAELPVINGSVLGKRKERPFSIWWVWTKKFKTESGAKKWQPTKVLWVEMTCRNGIEDNWENRNDRVKSRRNACHSFPTNKRQNFEWEDQNQTSNVVE